MDFCCDCRLARMHQNTSTQVFGLVLSSPIRQHTRPCSELGRRVKPVYACIELASVHVHVQCVRTISNEIQVSCLPSALSTCFSCATRLGWVGLYTQVIIVCHYQGSLPWHETAPCHWHLQLYLRVLPVDGLVRMWLLVEL